MGEVDTLDELARRMAAAVRSAVLYSPEHPVVKRGLDALSTLSAAALQRADPVVIGFVGDEVVVNGQRLLRSAASLAGFARDLREREIEKVTLTRGVTKEEFRAFVFALLDRKGPTPLATRLEQAGVRRISVGRINLEQDDDG